MGTPQQVRQGDVLLQPVRQVPRGTKQVAPVKGRHILAFGEATGHAHAVAARHTQVLEDERGTRYLVVERETPLQHEEHGSITVAIGTYRIVRQREYQPEEPRLVRDEEGR